MSHQTFSVPLVNMPVSSFAISPEHTLQKSPTNWPGFYLNQLSTEFESRETFYTNILAELADRFFHEITDLHARIADVLLL